jgi:tetratricopeptide (TPR) repeat protein
MKRFIHLLLLLVVLLALSPRATYADAPYITYAAGADGAVWMTQEAYTPLAEIELPVSGPEDMFITDEGVMYIADTGNGRIVKLDSNFAEEASYGDEVLDAPTGLFVDEEGVMYVADGGLNNIVILSPDGEVINQFGRPEEPLFGRNREFLPRKIEVDARENLYVISEGSVNGIAQMNKEGNFIGYFGANSASMSLTMVLRRLFLTDAQLEQFILNEAASPSNLVIDHESLVFTVTSGASDTQAIKRFTISGKNIFPEPFISSPNFRDIHVSDNGLVVAVDGEALIYEYDVNGTLLFVFGALDTGEQRLGTLRNPTAIARYGEQLYVLDKDKNAIVSYETTAFAQQVHAGVSLYTEGYYEEAKPFFEQVLDYNGSYIMGYQAIADASFKDFDYQGSLENYRLAADRSGYSQAFWELRNQMLQRHLANVLIGMVALGVVWNIAERMDRRYDWSAPFRTRLKDLTSIKWVDDFVFMFRFIKQPVDSFYYIKKGLRGSLGFAFLLYAAVVVIRILTLYVTGFIFNPNGYYYFVDVAGEITTTIGLFLLWNGANYLVSTISDGEGRVRDVVIGSAYSLFPYILIALPVALISNVLTENEQFLYSFPLTLMWGWIGIMLFIMVMEIHNYSFGETVRNIVVTLFTMALIVLTGYILYVLFNQLYEFIMAIAQELRLRV